MKKYLIGSLAVLLALAGTAFTAKKANHVPLHSPSTVYYYKYTLNTATGENTASNYVFISPQPTNPNTVPGCGGSQLPCVIHATGNMTNPDASQVTVANLPSVTVTQKNSQ